MLSDDCHLVREFGDRGHHRDDVEDLEAALLRFLDRLLAGDHQHRHTAQRGIGGRCDEVGRPRPQSGDADAGLAGVAAIGCGHEARALFMPGQDQLDLGRRESESRKSRFSSPGTPKMYSQPSSSRHWMNRSDAFWPIPSDIAGSLHVFKDARKTCAHSFKFGCNPRGMSRNTGR
jgi:hypothetical protein